MFFFIVFSFNEAITYGVNEMSELKLFGRINSEAYTVNFKEIYKCLGEEYA